MNKLLSGKFLFTMAAAIVFVSLSVRGWLPMDKVQEIILVVVYAYFTKQDKPNGGTNA